MTESVCGGLAGGDGDGLGGIVPEVGGGNGGGSGGSPDRSIMLAECRRRPRVDASLIEVGSADV